MIVTKMSMPYGRRYASPVPTPGLHPVGVKAGVEKRKFGSIKSCNHTVTATHAYPAPMAIFSQELTLRLTKYTTNWKQNRA